MSASTFQIAFRLGERVRIKDIEAEGVIYTISLGMGGTQFEVKWFTNSDRKSDWFREEELEDAR